MFDMVTVLITGLGGASLAAALIDYPALAKEQSQSTIRNENKSRIA